MTRPPGGGLQQETNGAVTPTVEAFFGDLLDTVALDAPVSRDRLVRALVAVQTVATARRATIRDASTTGVTVFGDVSIASVPVELWSEIAAAGGLTATDEVAVRETHRRLALATVSPRLPPGSDSLLVLPP